MKQALAFLLLSLAALSAHAHALAPALLELRETAPGIYAVQWRSSLVRALGRDVVPVMPEGCTAQGAVWTRDAAGARQQDWTLRCTALSGRSLRIDGLEGSGVNVILRLQPIEGAMQQALLGERTPSYTILQPQAAPPVLSGYLRLGIEHLLLGFDHLLFVVALLLLVRGTRRLVLTITAFTLGHSLTLSLAVLGIVRVDAALTEFAIALSILVLAVEILRRADTRPGLFARWPWLVAAGFGLLHGLGFAGALSEIGLPRDQVALALLAFNLGIEAAQLLLIGVWMLAAAALRQLPGLPLVLARALPAYLIGSMAAYWCWQRVTSFV